MVKNTWGKIDSWMTSRSLLHRRMDATRDLVEMKDFKLQDFKKKRELDNVINVTGNRGASYGVRVMESLVSHKWQTVVGGDISKREAHIIEEFLNASLDQTNIYLSEHFEDVPDLYTFWAKHICNRGRIGAQWMSWIEGGEYKIHCAPLDMRWTAYVRNKWVAPIYFRNKEDLEEELEGYEKKAKDEGGEYRKINLGEGTDLEIRDYWDAVIHELWVMGQLAYTEKHNYKKPPFVIVVAPSGFMFRDKGYSEHEGEDIYFLIRKLEAELNRSLSVEQTVGMYSLFPGYERERENFDARPAESVPKSGEIRAVKKGERAQPVSMGDMNRASQYARQDLLRMMDDGAPMSPHTYTQPPPAVTVAAEVELLSQLQNSRVVALQMGLSSLYRLMVEMCIIAGENYKGDFEIGSLGKQKHFPVVQLKDPNRYSISCRLMGQNTKLDIISEARAMALWGRAPTKYILEEILKVEDPAGWMREMELQKAKEINPAISLIEMGLGYLEEAEDITDEFESEVKREQAKILAHEYVTIMRQRINPPLAPVMQRAREPEIKEETGNANPLIALTGQAGMGIGGGQRRQSEEVIE